MGASRSTKHAHGLACACHTYNRSALTSCTWSDAPALFSARAYPQKRLAATSRRPVSVAIIFQHVTNNPLKYIDPTGHEGQSPDLTGLPGWYQSIACLFSHCVEANGHLYAQPDPLSVMPVPAAVGEEAGTGIIGSLFKRVAQFFRTGTPPTMQSALAQVLEEGDIVGMRSRPVAARFFEGWFPSKTTGASGAAAVIKPQIGPVDTGIRVAFNWENFSTYVSDLDIGYIIRGGKFLPPREIETVIQGANKIYGQEIFTHGDLWNGANAGVANIEPHHLHSLTHVFEVHNGSLNYWFSGGFMETIGRLFNTLGGLWSK